MEALLEVEIGVLAECNDWCFLASRNVGYEGVMVSFSSLDGLSEEEI